MEESNEQQQATSTVEEKTGSTSSPGWGTNTGETSGDADKQAVVRKNNVDSRGYLSFEEARLFSTSLNLKTRSEWRTYVKGGLPGAPEKPSNIPAHPDGIYKVKGWQGWKFWLGTAEAGSQKKKAKTPEKPEVEVAPQVQAQAAQASSQPQQQSVQSQPQ